MKEKYEIWFEIFGKKMKTEVIAISEDQAKSILMSKIIFHKVKLKDSKDLFGKSSDDIFNSFTDLFGNVGNPFK
jgi:hypothetical protein